VEGAKDPGRADQSVQHVEHQYGRQELCTEEGTNLGVKAMLMMNNLILNGIQPAM